MLAMAENESQIQHPGLKGRLRELLIDNMLTPWLAPYISCGTGTIIAAEDIQRQSTQEDIIIYDSSLVPPVLASRHAPEGVFLFNSVILRVEVKSTLSRDDIRKFIKASVEISKMKFTVQSGFRGNLMGPLNMLFAYKSDAVGEGNQDYQLSRIIEVMKEEQLDTESGIFSAVCMPGYGFWKIAQDEKKAIRWQRLNSNNPVDHLTWFVSVLSHTCYQEHAKRQGRDPTLGVEGGIGMFIPGGIDVWQWI